MKKIFIFLLLFFVSFAVFAVDSLTIAPKIKVYAGGTFIHPTSKYFEDILDKDSPYFRGSISCGTDISPFHLIFKKFEFGVGFSANYTGKNVAAGTPEKLASIGYGFFAEQKFYFKNTKWGMSVTERFLFCNLIDSTITFNTLELDISPSYELLRQGNIGINLITPLVLSYRADALCCRISVGFDIKCNILLQEKNED